MHLTHNCHQKVMGSDRDKPAIPTIIAYHRSMHMMKTAIAWTLDIPAIQHHKLPCPESQTAVRESCKIWKGYTNIHFIWDCECSWHLDFQTTWARESASDRLYTSLKKLDSTQLRQLVSTSASTLCLQTSYKSVWRARNCTQLRSGQIWHALQKVRSTLLVTNIHWCERAPRCVLAPLKQVYWFYNFLFTQKWRKFTWTLSVSMCCHNPSGSCRSTPWQNLWCCWTGLHTSLCQLSCGYCLWRLYNLVISNLQYLRNSLGSQWTTGNPKSTHPPQHQSYSSNTWPYIVWDSLMKPPKTDNNEPRCNTRAPSPCGPVIQTFNGQPGNSRPL